MAFAEITATQIAEAYAEYDFVEVKTGLSQVKVEATSGGQALEVIYDIATGEILKSEVEVADEDDLNRTGVEFDVRDEDFIDDDDDDDDD